MATPLIKDARICREIGGITMHHHCYINNDELEAAEIKCEQLDGIVHELPYETGLDGFVPKMPKSHASVFLCELPYSSLRDIPKDKFNLLKKNQEGNNDAMW